MDREDLERLRVVLQEKRDALLRRAEKTLAEEAEIDRNDLPDEIDQASSEYQQSLIFRLRDREKFLIKKIDLALRKIDTGDYGICKQCEEEIAIKRLMARPVTDLCIRCKEEQEQMEKSYL